MSAKCQNFVQNAWKKELCSNCFKSKDEHVQRLQAKLIAASLNKAVGSIIKGNTKAKAKRNVNFNKELVEVIGYGGEDWSEEEQDVEVYEESNEDETDSNEEEEKELLRLTKENTHFNASSLNDKSELKMSYAQLKLGKPQMDAEGRKQTLMVSVTPFGQDVTNKKTKSHIPIAKNKDTVVDNKNVVLTSYAKSMESQEKEEKSLLEEITETLENSKNPIQIISRKKIQKEITLTIPNQNTIANKENIKDDHKDHNENKNNKLNVPERRIGLTRNNVIKRDEKPHIIQSAMAKIDMMNNKNTKNYEKDDLVNNNINKEMKIPITIKDRLQLLEQKVDLDKSSKSESESISTDDSSSHCSSEESAKDDSDSSLEKIDSGLDKFRFSQSRELAGVPDGRADPEEATEPPALPLTPPPPLESHATFTPSPEKPKIPSKPSTIIIRKPIILNQHNEQPNVLTTFSMDTKVEAKLVKQDSNGSDVSKAIINKRRAPKPPSEENIPIYTRNTSMTTNIDSPVVREKEKRERASSCSPKTRNPEQPNEIKENVVLDQASRRSLSLSTDSLVDDKKKSRGRFSLKKFLRMGSNKELHKISSELSKCEDESTMPVSKPRLVIVHPLDLNNTKVEVVNKSNDMKTIEGDYAQRAAKPPPPPRHYDEVKPNMPHPPKSVELMNKHKYTPQKPLSTKTDSVYANIGEVRLAITPHKPQRTASMREREAQQQSKMNNSNHTYEPVDVKKQSTENVYDYINGRSSSPECEIACNGKPSLKAKPIIAQRSESNNDVSSEYYKFQNIPRSMSLTYCGSETESEIYSPYSCYGSESEIAEDDHEWNGSNGRTHKLRSRKGRSIVHKNLEDNYGAVVIANHEALAQVLENIQHATSLQPALRGLKSTANLRWSDFIIRTTIPSLTIGSRIFHQAIWSAQHVTLVISAGSVPTSPLSLGIFNLLPITEFNDLIPVKYLASNQPLDVKHLQATVAVLPCMQVNTIQTYGELLKTKSSNEDIWKDASFILLQLVNALKTLQAQGIEELPSSLTSFVLCKDMEKESHSRLCVLQGLGEDLVQKPQQDVMGTLCMCVITALKILDPNAKLGPLLNSLLNTERAISLTQVKSVLEFSLWGPSDVVLGNTVRERELALQRWLDLQRATVLHGLVCTKVQLTVYEECHLLFLVRSNAKMMCDASLLLDSTNKQNLLTNINK